MLFFCVDGGPPMSTVMDTLFPYTTLFRFRVQSGDVVAICSGNGGEKTRDEQTPVLLQFEAAHRVIRSGNRVERRVQSPIRHQPAHAAADRSEEHTSELQSLMRIAYAVF